MVPPAVNQVGKSATAAAYIGWALGLWNPKVGDHYSQGG